MPFGKFLSKGFTNKNRQLFKMEMASLIGSESCWLIFSLCCFRCYLKYKRRPSYLCCLTWTFDSYNELCFYVKIYSQTDLANGLNLYVFLKKNHVAKTVCNLVLSSLTWCYILINIVVETEWYEHLNDYYLLGTVRHIIICSVKTPCYSINFRKNPTGFFLNILLGFFGVCVSFCCIFFILGFRLTETTLALMALHSDKSPNSTFFWVSH